MVSEGKAQTGFCGWYRRFYLLVNVPILLLLTEVFVTRYDVANRPPFDRANDLVHAFERYDASPPGDRPVMLLLGNSVMLSGVDQRAVETGLDKGTRVYNFGLGGACIDDEFKLVDLLSERGVVPNVVVLGVNLYGVIDRQRDVLRAAEPRRSPYLYFHRSRIRTALGRAIKKGHLEWKPYGQFTNVTKVSDKLLENATRALVADFGNKASYQFPMIARLIEFRAWLAARGVSLHVVLLPMNPMATTRLQNYTSLMAAVRAASPPDTLDLSTYFGAELFHDEGHYNEAGREELTARVVAWLQQKGAR